MSILARKQVNTPDALKNEVVTARQQFEAVKNDVLNRVADRQAAVQATIADLQAESASLSAVREDTRSL